MLGLSMLDHITKYATFYKWLGIALGLLALAGLSFGLGRYGTPPREVVRIQQVEVVRTVDKLVYRDRVVTKRVAAKTTRVEERSDGTRVTTTVDRKADTITAEKSSEASREASAERVLEVAREVKSLPDWSLGAMAGYDGRAQGLVLGGQLERRIVGPLKGFVWLTGVPAVGPQSMAGGLGLAIEF